ncbi:hypothetical protein ACLKA6_016127 [Drosophila palustris]
MGLCLLVLIAIGSLLFWLYQLNKDYFVLAFFAPRVRTKDGRPLESIAPVAKGKTIFGNCFDLYGTNDAEFFQHSRIRAKELRSSYLEYGLGTPIYNIIDADNAELVLNDQSLITKSLIYDFLKPALRTGLLTSTDKKWHSRRKMLTPTFHFNILGQFEEVFKAESLKFVKQFEGQSETDISLSELIPRFTLNSICETAMGVKLDDMAEKGDLYRQNFAMIEKCFIKRLSNPFYWNKTIYEIFEAKDDAPALKIVHDFSSEIIAKRRLLLKEELKQRQNSQTADEDIYINKKQRFAMLDTLIFAEKDGLIDHAGICEEVDTLMFEGFDTTSMGLIFGLMNMSLYADKQELCYQEVSEFIDDDFSNVDINQISKLKYLECFVKETMRMFPSVPIMARQTVRETELANGLIFPARSQITLHVFDIHRNPKYWDSPDEFRPERFLPENSKDRHTYAYIPFSAGQRNCIGQKYAMLEMKTLLIVVLKQFKILPLVDPKDFVFHTGITLRTKNNIKVKTKDGRPVESIAPVVKGKTIFGNSFDLYGKTEGELQLNDCKFVVHNLDNLFVLPAAMFQELRKNAKEIGISYLKYIFGMPIYLIIDAENAELILNDQDLITKAPTYEFLYPALRTGLLTSTDKKWHSRRKMLTPTFHFNILGQFEEIFKAESLKFVKQFQGQSEVLISLSELIPRFTLNSICETAMGVKLDDMAEKGDLYRQNFAMIEKCFIRRLSNPFLWNKTIYKLFGAKNDAPALKIVHEFSSEIIAKRRLLLKEELKQSQNLQTDEDIYINKKQRFAMLDTLIFAEKDGLIDHEGICEEVDTLMFEGFDTTSIGLIFGLMNMSLYADKQELCYQEVSEFIKDDLSNLDINQISKLKYLDCFVKETMRMFPSVPGAGRQTIRETELANGLILPARSQITLHIFDIHRNPKYWDSPDEFRPERFLPENSKDRHTYAYIPFSAGQRNCIGQKYAMLEMKTLLIVVLKQFKILPLVDPKDFFFNIGITLRTKNNIKVNLLFWLYQLNKDYVVLAFFSPRVRTKDGRPVESIAPVAKGNTIFGNSFDVFGTTEAEFFQDARLKAKEVGTSYLEYSFGMPVYNIIDAENAELVLNNPSLITKGLIYDFLQPALRTGLLTSADKKWHSRRKMLTPTFHFNILGQFEEVFKAESLKFVKQFEGQSESDISLTELIPRFTLNSICETAMGVKLDDMAEKGDDYRQNFFMIEKRFVKRMSNPLFWNKTIYELFGAKKDVPQLKVVHEFSSEIIAKRRLLLKEELKQRQNLQTADEDIYINKKERFAMLDTLIFAEKDGLIDHEGICEEVDTLMFGGFDTTSIGLAFALMNMSFHADKQELCYQEVSEFIDDDLSKLDINQISKLKYLDCFIKESMRMFPSVPGAGRQTIRETELANGLILPARCQINLHIFDIHCNPKYWDSPEEFRPERFLPENSKDRHTYAYIPFSAGQRNCIGQKYAMLEMKTFLIVVLKHFKILPLFDPKELVLNVGITLRTNNNVKVKLVRRK